MTDALHTAIENAIDAEIRIRDFYLSAVGKVESDLSRDVLKFLAAQEMRHIADIQDFHKSIDGALIQFNLDERIAVVTRDKAREFFGQHRKDFEATVDASPHDVEIYRLALAMEKNGYTFYHTQAQAAVDERARRLFSFLEAEEIEHYELTENISAFFLDPVGWNTKEEKWFFEG